MTRSLYTKFLLGYLVFGLLGFIFIATMSSEITYQYLLEEKSDSLYDEANLLASTYSDIYQGKNISLSTAVDRANTFQRGGRHGPASSYTEGRTDRDR